MTSVTCQLLVAGFKPTLPLRLAATKRQIKRMRSKPESSAPCSRLQVSVDFKLNFHCDWQGTDIATRPAGRAAAGM